MKKLLVVLLLITTNSFAWRIDYSLVLPGTAPTGVDVINYLIFSKELVSAQNEKMHSPLTHKPVVVSLQSGSGPS